jgi:serine/threonine protein kinase
MVCLFEDVKKSLLTEVFNVIYLLFTCSKVLKEIPVGDLQQDEALEVKHEADLQRNLDHPSIVRFHDCFVDSDNFCIVTEYCEVCHAGLFINI